MKEFMVRPLYGGSGYTVVYMGEDGRYYEYNKEYYRNVPEVEKSIENFNSGKTVYKEYEWSKLPNRVRIKDYKKKAK